MLGLYAIIIATFGAVFSIIWKGMKLCLKILLAPFKFVAYIANPFNWFKKPRFRPMGGDKTGWEFEEECADILRKSHKFHSIEVTPGSHDHGADITATDWRGRRWVWQCKYYSYPVGQDAVDQVLRSVEYYHADCAGVITNSTYSSQTRDYARKRGVGMVDGSEIDRLKMGYVPESKIKRGFFGF